MYWTIHLLFNAFEKEGRCHDLLRQAFVVAFQVNGPHLLQFDCLGLFVLAIGPMAIRTSYRPYGYSY